MLLEGNMGKETKTSTEGYTIKEGMNAITEIC